MKKTLRGACGERGAVKLRVVSRGDHPELLEEVRLESRDEIGAYLRKHPPEEGRAYDLSGMDLSGLDFSDVNFSAVRLTGANMRRAILDRATMHNGADLSEADLTGASLINARIVLTTAKNTVFDRADLRGAYLGYSDFSDSHFKNANFSEAILDVVAMAGCQMQYGCFLGAKLIEPDFSGAVLDYADFSDLDATLSVYLEKASLMGTQMPKGSDVEYTQVAGSGKLSAASLRRRRKSGPGTKI